MHGRAAASKLCEGPPLHTPCVKGTPFPPFPSQYTTHLPQLQPLVERKVPDGDRRTDDVAEHCDDHEQGVGGDEEGEMRELALWGLGFREGRV